MSSFLLISAYPPHVSTAQTTIPQDHAYQVTLRDYLITFSESDYDVSLAPFDFSAFDTVSDTDELYPLWLYFKRRNHLPATFTIRAPSQNFVLSTIEAPNSIDVYPNYEASAWWVGFDFPGNPYFNDEAIKRRVFVQAAVDLMMLDAAHDVSSSIRRSDFLGGSLEGIAYSFLKTRDILPANVQAAFFEGLERMLSKLESWGPRLVNTNMDMKALPAMYFIYLASGQDPQIKQRVVDQSRIILFGGTDKGPDSDVNRFDKAFMPAGYISEGGGPETGYNGLSFYYILAAGLATKGIPEYDAFLPEVIDRMSKFRAYNTWPDPDGRYDGPTNWSTRTAQSMVSDQSNSYMRSVGAAMLSDEAKYLLRDRNGQSWYKYPYVPNVSEMREHLRSRSYGDFTIPYDGSVDPWKEDHWRSTLPYVLEYYVPGSYQSFVELDQSNDVLVQAPVERAGDFNEAFANDFWIVKKNDWGFQVSTAGMSWYTWKRNLPGLDGGALSLFWTKDAGIVFVGRIRGYNAHPGDIWSNIDTWATHHIWGKDDSGRPFTTARNRNPVRSYGSSSVTVQGEIGSHDNSRTAPNGAITGQVSYSRQFVLESDGLRITSTVTSDESDTVTELWESLPIFLGVIGQTMTQISFESDGQWRDPGTSPTASVTRVRLTRFGSDVYVDFDEPQALKLSPQIWSTDYQATDLRLRTIHIDLLGSGNTPTPMPASVSVSYKITTVDNSQILPPNEDPSVALSNPSGGSTFNTTDTILLRANATDTDGSVVRVDFRADDVKVGEDDRAPFEVAWQVMTPGEYSLTAVATDDRGSSVTSAEVSVSVQDVPNGPVIDSPSLAVTVDGNASEWSGASFEPMLEINPSLVFPDAADVFATFSTAWDATYLYVFAKVEDDEYDVTGGATIWEHDGIEILIDGLNNHTSTYLNDDHQILVRADGVIEAEGYTGGSDIIGVGTRTATGYAVEVAVRWAFIEGSPPQTNQTYGFNISVNDRDGEAFENQITWKYVAEHWKNTSAWDDIILVGSSVLGSSIQQAIALEKGWNLVSTYIAPTNPSMEAVFSGILPELVLVKDANDGLFDPGTGTNTLGSWTPTTAYLVNVRNASTLTLAGDLVVPESTSIQLQLGWNLVPYLRGTTMPVEEAMAPVSSKLVMVKDEHGNVYYPEFGINGIKSLKPGLGYKIFVTEAITLTFPPND